MDLVDKELIKLLASDALQSRDLIAKKLGATPGTVRRRIRKLIDNNAIRVVAAIDPVQAGLPLTVLIGFDVEVKKLESAVNSVAARPEVTWAGITTGRFDLMLMARLPSTDDLFQFIKELSEQVDGLRDSETFVATYTAKGYYSLIYTSKTIV